MITVFGANTTLEDLQRIPLVRPPKAGAYWQGVPHGALVNTLSDEIRSRGWTITDQKFSLSKDKGDLVGAFGLKIKGVDAPEGQSLSLGFITSNMMRVSLKLLVGTNVAVCSNGMATGEIVMQRKHTHGFNMIQEIEYSLDQYIPRAHKINHIVEGLQETVLSSTRSDEILMEAGRNRLMPWSRIGAVDKEYRNPTFAEHGKDTSWALLNAFTHTVKRNPPLQQMEQMNRFRELLPSQYVPEVIDAEMN
jgi:hypothetical protein